MRSVFFLAIPAAIIVTVISFAERPPPDEKPLTPKAVVEAQLQALKTNDQPEADHGITVAWQFAHPKNKQATGPLPRFRAMLHGPAYEPLLNHRSHSVEALSVSGGRAAFEVVVIAQGGARLKYLWVVERIDPANEESPWRTTMVSAPSSAGGSLV